MAKHSSIYSLVPALAALAMLLSSGAAWAAPSARLALAEQPLRVIRAADVYQAASGTPLEQDDIVETGAGGAQIELDSGTIVAIGPQTRLYLGALGAGPKGSAELALLQGWIKVQTGAGRALIAGEALQASVGGGAAVVFSRPGRDALFADAGEQLAAPVTGPGKAGPMQKVASESYVQADAGKPLLMLPRADPQFLRDMPPPFRDRLAPAPQPAKPVKVAAQRQRAADFADVEGWLRCNLAVRRHFVARFRARLQDPRFRQQLDQALGHGSEWQAVLHPVVKHPSTP
ncbi:hypothetical protein H3H37_15925 [Duganella sp. LX20W]|uniref:FecR protein domain-containing protein n=1 Tax=Rugamonas brunnea TaxID=2758569 RepID=A0A7W2ICN9_9BURK|nr:hypothetical protein [Rugamonas brunnea]MBA5638549.1 hypothetical protein [Rugamonas brunnea]